MSQVTIHTVSEDMADALLTIYKPYVEHTAITFEYEVPSVEEFRSRIRNTLAHYPYLVAQLDGQIVGYAYAGTFKARAAYAHCVETTIYIEQSKKGLGIGRKLYDALELELQKMGIINLYACIAYPRTEDEYLTCDSVRFHQHLGYKTCGTFHQCGYKFNRWYDMVWMEKFIGNHP